MNCQNISQKISIVIITSISKQESFVSAWTSSTEVASVWTAKTATGCPGIPQTQDRHKIALCNYFTVTRTIIL